MAEKKTTAKKTAVKKADLSPEQQLQALRADLLEYKKSHAAGELVNPRVLGQTRKEVARVMTKLNAKKEAK